MKNDPVEIIADQIYTAIDMKTSNLLYDKTISSKVTEVISPNEYVVRIGKNYRNIKSRASRKYNIGDVATVEIPCGDWNEARIIDKNFPYIQTGSSNITIDNFSPNTVISYEIPFPFEIGGIPVVIPVIVSNQNGAWNFITLTVKETTNAYFVVTLCNTSNSLINTELTIQYVAIYTSNI